MKTLYQIKPVYKAALWGGQQLINKYGYQTELVNIGECYNVIAIPDHLDCEVEETGEKLSEFFINNRDLFGCDTAMMPVRAAMACTKEPMSVQIHPSDEYALAHEGKLGKPDGVYVISGAGSVCFGHQAKSLSEFKDLVERAAWDDLLCYVEVKAGDFLDMPHGTLHALGANMVYIEFSQNADLTYRLYDYGRESLDPRTGKRRELHKQQVYDCVNIPDGDRKVSELITEEVDGCLLTMFHHEPQVYSCGKIELESQGYYQRPQFYFLTCIEGSGVINDTKIKAGMTLFVPCDFGRIRISGKLTMTYLTYVEA